MNADRQIVEADQRSFAMGIKEFNTKIQRIKDGSEIAWGSSFGPLSF
jgi:hypothetical protein